MLKRILSRVFSSDSTNSTVIASPHKAAMENLETRVLFHNPVVVSGIADNRGEVQLTLDPDSAEIGAAQFNKSSVQMYEAGPDGILANADDVRVAASVRFTPSTQRLIIRGTVPAGNGYRVKIVSSRIAVSPGFAFDGNFNGSFPSGDGVAGGNFEMQVKNDRSSTPQVRMYTTEGLITLRMRGDLAPNTFRNFLTYANSARYDNTFFARSEPNFVIQGGSLQITGDGDEASDIVASAKEDPIAEEFNATNARGTVAMAKGGVNNLTTTNQFFFSLTDNSFLDAQQFTVFAELYGAPSLAVADAINAKPIADLTSQIGSAGQAGNAGVDTVPVQNKAIAEADLNPSRDLIYIRRTVMRSRIAAL